VKHPESYLEIAASGSEALETDPRRTSIFDCRQDDIANELQMRGLAVKTDVGLSDFRVDLSLAPTDAPDRPLLAVLLNGDSWKSGRTVAALPQHNAGRSVEAAIREIVATEGPVHLVRLAKIVTAAFDRPSPTRPRAGARSSQQPEGRPLDLVSLVEIANAMSIVAEASGGLTKPDLKREVLTVFGGNRVTERSAPASTGLWHGDSRKDAWSGRASESSSRSTWAEVSPSTRLANTS